jgi:GTPase SAR1 family protein
MQAPKKLLIVGEANTGKTALIKAFLQYEEQHSNAVKMNQ